MKLFAVAAAALLAGCTASAVERRPTVQETPPAPPAAVVTPESSIAAAPGDAGVAPGSAPAQLSATGTPDASPLVASATVPAATPEGRATETAPSAAGPQKSGESALEPVDAYLSQLARRRPIGQPEPTKEPESPAAAGSTEAELGAQPSRRKPIVSQPQAPQRYAGAHPKPEVLGDGWCQVEGVHEHPYPPEDATLFELEAGVYRFTGPVQLTYSDFHPKPSGGWCQAPGPHPHSYLPPPPYQTSFEYDSEEHYYVYRPRDGAPKKPTQFVPAASDEELAGSEDGVGTGPEAGTTSRGNAIRATALGRTEYAESTEGRGDLKESGSERREGASSGQPGAAGLPREMVSRQGSSSGAGRQTSSLSSGFKAPPRSHHHGGHHGGGHHGGGHHGGGGHHPGGGHHGGGHHGGGHHGGGHHRDGHSGGHRGPRR